VFPRLKAIAVTPEVSAVIVISLINCVHVVVAFTWPKKSQCLYEYGTTWAWVPNAAGASARTSIFKIYFSPTCVWLGNVMKNWLFQSFARTAALVTCNARPVPLAPVPSAVKLLTASAFDVKLDSSAVSKSALEISSHDGPPFPGMIVGAIVLLRYLAFWFLSQVSVCP
jgi:hypothetical protein